jgi:choline dehydrogenase-like flavoprotein
MIADLDELGDSPHKLNADVCVVGGGAVGLVLATQLARTGRSVIVLEGGGRGLEMDSQALHRGTSVGHPFANIAVGRYRALGGSTLYWGGQLIPFDAHVTGARPWLNHEEWPVPAEELTRLYHRAYAALGLDDALLEDSAVWKRLGSEIPDAGERLQVEISRWVKIRNLAKHFRGELQAPAGRLRVLVHANVVGLAMNAGRTRVDSVLVRSLRGKRCEVRAASFVLANGTLEIVRLLLHPLADGRVPPWTDSPWLGRPFIDHLDCVAAQVFPSNHRQFGHLFDAVYISGYKYFPRLRLRPDVQRREGLVDIAAQFLYKTRVSEHMEVLRMFWRSLRDGTESVSWNALPRHILAVLSTIAPLALRYFREHRSFKPRDAEVSLALFCEQLPNEESRLRLGAETDALGMRRIEVDWRIDGREIDTIRAAAFAIRDFLESRNIASVAIDADLASGNPSFVAKLHDAIHQMGATRMARTRENGFVDPDLKVFGTENLHIAGATVFPSTGSSNPTFTAMALAIRLADHLSSLRAASAPAGIAATAAAAAPS